MNAGAKLTAFRGQSFLPGLLLILFIVSGASAVWDYFRVDAITRDLAMREARGLIFQVEREIEAAAAGEQTVRSILDDQLFGAAWLILQLDRSSGLSDNRWEDIAVNAGVLTIDVVDRHGNRVGGTTGGIGLGKEWFQNKLQDLSWSDQDAISLGMIELGELESFPSSSAPSLEPEMAYAAAMARSAGGLLVVTIDGYVLDQYRRSVGLSSTLSHLSDHPEVHFAVLASGGTLLAATRDLPSWVGGPEDSFYEWETPADEVTARFTKTPGGEAVFEAVTTLASLENVTLRLALKADELRSIRARSLVALSLRTVLFILLGGVTLMFLVARQNQRLLAAETDRIRREVERLEADRRAKERLEAMGKLAGGVAHEIRNPLNTVEMVAQRLELEFEPTSDRDEYLSMVTTMRSEAKRIGKIVQDFLAFARPPATNRQMGSLAAVLERTITLFRPMAEAQGVQVALELGMVKEFAFDHEQVGQAVQNLLRNALEAVPESGGEIRVRLDEEGSYATVEVADNGPGIPVEERVRVFHLYHTTKAEGTGVGLSLVHRIADEHGGRVEIDDTPGGGATLRLYLKRESA